MNSGLCLCNAIPKRFHLLHLGLPVSPVSKIKESTLGPSVILCQVKTTRAPKKPISYNCPIFSSFNISLPIYPSQGCQRSSSWCRRAVVRLQAGDYVQAGVGEEEHPGPSFQFGLPRCANHRGQHDPGVGGWGRGDSTTNYSVFVNVWSFLTCIRGYDGKFYWSSLVQRMQNYQFQSV